MESTTIVLENESFLLAIGSDCTAKELLYKPENEECLMPGTDTPLFSVTLERPYNNEVKLSHPNRRTTFPADRVRKEGDRLIIGFETAPFEAVVSCHVTAQYFTFTLVDFIVHPTDYPGLRMDKPPVSAFRLLNLPVRNRARFGEWLNVSHDDRAAVCVCAVTPEADIQSERRAGYRLMAADAVRDIRLRGVTAALIVSAPDRLLDALDALEHDFGLPLGAESRRSDAVNASVYWSSDITPANVDAHIRRAKQGGFRMMLLYYTCVFREQNGYSLNGNYDYRPEYPRGKEDLAAMLEKLRASGITPGLHVLQTHIGIRSRYCTPIADHRLHLTKHFTLARALDECNTDIRVEENPAETVMEEHCRVLQFGGELISYESYTTEPPYRFTGCRRGWNDTVIHAHPCGEIGGILDISEYGATSVYLDQNSSLADEIADKIADAYNAGFRFMYFDGSEGTNAPFGYHVPMAQYRVWKKLSPKPLFTEGAAKAHFGWHHLSGGNAFDVFAPEIFKEKIDEFPAEEAPRMRMDFTRLNFGWWGFWSPSDASMGTQPDIYEYGTSHAAGWDCPATIQISLAALDRHPRTDDILEVMRRWEDVRARHLLTDEQKALLRENGKEYHLLIGETGEYELVPVRQIAVGVPDVRAFVFQRKGCACVLFWHCRGACDLLLPLRREDVTVCRSFAEPPLSVAAGECADSSVFRAEGCRYLTAACSEEDLCRAFASAELLK